MKQQIIAFVFIILALFGILFAFFSLTKPKAVAPIAKTAFNQKEITYFYGNTCPHCAALSKWLEENRVADKVKFVKKEVYQDRDNAQQLEQAAQICGLPTNSIGVPFIFAKSKCYVGTDQAKDFFQKQL